MGTHVYRFLRHSELTAAQEGTLHRRPQENGVNTTRNINCVPRNNDTVKRKLRVRFLLPEETNIEKQEIEVFPDTSELPRSSLPAICEFMIFSQRMNNKKIKQKTVLPKQPIVRKPTEQSTVKQQRESSSIIKLPPATTKCSKQELKIDSNCKMPEDYKEPSQIDTRRRILAWLNEAEKAKPAYRRRMDSCT